MASAVALCAAVPAMAQEDAAPVAAKFGARNSVSDIEISPDGSRAVLIAPTKGRGAVAMVANFADGSIKPVMMSDGAPFTLRTCGWSGPNRIVCGSSAVETFETDLVNTWRMISFNADGGDVKALSGKSLNTGLAASFGDGGVLDWLSGDNDTVLMSHVFLPEETTGSIMSNGKSGVGVVMLNTRTLKMTTVLQPTNEASDFISDGHGNVRIRAIGKFDGADQATGNTVFQYRLAGAHDWKPFSIVDEHNNGLMPIAVDPNLNVAYALNKLDGREALYRVKLDGSMASELVYSDPHVSAGGVDYVGRDHHIIAATYTTDKSYAIYFDAAYEKLQASLEKALPNHPTVSFVSASADEKKLIILASSDVDPGRFYLYDRETHSLAEISPVAPQLADTKLSPLQSITYNAADGTPIPAYLTLPPGKSDMKGLPAIVLPHGGPESRDLWGYDWLSQFFAARGFAVLQPEFRGSAGYGDSWLLDNAFKGWRTAIGDVNSGGRWLVSQGVDPAKLAIFGWSFGGYAALQANVLDPNLFKAVVAVAPVTDLGMMKADYNGTGGAEVMRRYFGSMELAQEASPDKHAAQFRAPVLMFQGDHDKNVDITQSKAMNAALKSAGKETTLVIYPGLDHQLDDSAVRASMLTQADTFLRQKLGL